MVPANAEAVYFADRAELLACLAQAWCDGNQGTRWWWRGLFREIDIAQSALKAWLDSPPYVPGVFQHLATKGQAVQFVCLLRAGEALTLLQRVMHAFALSGLQSALSVVFDGGALVTNRPAEIRHASEIQVPSHSSLALQEGPIAPPWQRWVPEGRGDALRLEQRCLIGIGLMLQRAPMVVRSLSFMSVVAQWVRQERCLDLAELGTSSPSNDSGTTSRQVQADQAAGLSADKDERTIQERTDTTRSERQLAGNITNRPASQDSDASEDSHANDAMPVQSVSSFEQGEYDQRNLRPSDQGARLQSRIVLREQETLLPVERPVIPPPTFSSVQEVEGVGLSIVPVETAFGGVFYLINFGLHLNLYGDFSAPLQRGIDLSPWDFLALLGEQLIGERIHTDPVWPLLAQLAGRNDGESLGYGSEPPEEWRMPADWLAPLSREGVWYWETDGDRLRLRHPDGFCVLDVRVLADDPEQRLMQEIQTYPALHSIRPDFACPEHSQSVEGQGVIHRHTPLARWCSWLMPYVRARLMRAIGLEEPHDLSRMVCEHRARVFVTTTHVDVELALAELPVAIRFAGLDRNPGWIPAAGRYVAFHFV
jgi:hypothetical protein